MKCYKCGHDEREHQESLAYPGEPFCIKCFILLTTDYDPYHKFPDNLDLIEHLAKKRNLI